MGAPDTAYSDRDALGDGPLPALQEHDADVGADGQRQEDAAVGRNDVVCVTYALPSSR